MRSRTIPILGLLLASLVFQGEDCLLEQKTLSAVLGTSVPAKFVSQGFTESSGADSASVVVDADSLIRSALDDADIDYENIKSIAITGGCYEVTRSAGHDARREGEVFVDGQKLLAFDVPTNAPGTSGMTGDGTLTLDPAGITYLNSRLNAYLADLQDDGNTAPFEIMYRALWTSTPAPTAQMPDDFDWTTCITLQIEYAVQVDVPDPF